MFFTFIKDILSRQYRPQSKTILWLLGCILYVLSPWDLISDLLVPLGFTDDAVVVALTIKIFFDEWARYKKAPPRSPMFHEK